MDLTKRPLLAAAGIILLLLFGLAGLAGAEPGGEQTAKEETKLKSSFSDVAAGNKNLLFINYLAERGIISGFPDGSYHPREGLSRAEAAVVMVKAAGLEPKNGRETGFPDVNTEYWAAPYIASATDAGYLKGFPDGSYQPNEKLTRAQGIALVMRLCTQKEEGSLPQLKDMNTGHWAAQPMAMAMAAGMIDISADGHVYPEKTLERGSLARALGLLLTRDPGLYAKSLTGTIKDIKGEIKLTRSNQESLLANGSPVYAGDLIKAGPKSSASIFYPDGSSVLVEENTEINIKESEGRAYIKKDGSAGTAVENLNIGLNRGTVFGALAGKQETMEKQVAGAAYPLLASLNGTGLLAAQETLPWYQTAEQKKVKMKVDMPWGVAAVRGTFIMVTVNNDGSINLSCLSGDVELGNKNQNGQVQGTTSVSGGSSGGVSNQGGLNPVEGMTEADRQAFEQVQEWVLETALQMDVNQETALEMIVETPGLEVQSTLNVIVEALQNSGIQLQQEVIENLKQQLEEMEQEIPSFGPTAGQETTTNQNTGGSTESDTSSVTYINYSSAGTYGPTSAENRQSISKNVIVSASGVILQNMIISRDLTLAAGIGEGDVILNNVTVAGNTSILGGGAESVELIDCDLYTVSVDKENNSIRIVAQGSTSIGTVTLNSGAVLEESDLTGEGFGNVLASLSISEGATITLSGNFASVSIEAPGLTIQVESGSIGEFTIASSASETSLNLEPGTSIDTLQVNAAANIIGSGQITNAEITADGVEIQQVPVNWSIAEGISSNIGGEDKTGSGTGVKTTLSAAQMSLNTVAGTGDSISFTGLAAGTEIKVYDAATGGSLLAGSLSTISSGTAAYILTADLGASGQDIWVTATSAPNLESDRVKIAAVAEPVKTTLSAAQMTLNTVVGTGDSISFTGLADGTVIKVYDAATGGNQLAGSLSAISSGTATYTLAADLGASGQDIWVTATSAPNLESDRVKINAEAEPPVKTTLSAAQISLNTVVGTGDSISFTGLAAGTEIKVYDAATGGNQLAGSLSAISSGTAIYTLTADLGASGQDIWVTATSAPNLESDRVKINAVAEPLVATTIDISGPKDLSIPPDAGGSSSTLYSASIEDQNGSSMAGEVNWSIAEQDSLEGTVVIGNDGNLTVYGPAQSGPITLKAQAGSASSQYTVNLLPAWSYIGNPGISGALLDGSDIGLAVNSSGEVFTAYTEDAGSSGKVKVAFYGNNLWSLLDPDEYNNYPGKGPLDLELDNSDYPLVAWGDEFGQGGEEYAVVVMEGSYNGSTWGLATDPCVASSVYDVSVASIDGSPVVSYIDSGFVQSSMGVIDSISASELEMAVDWDEDYNYYPYLAYRDNSGNINVMQGLYYSGDECWGWQTATSVASGSGLSLAVADGVPYLAYRDSSNGKACVSKWDTEEENWTLIGEAASRGGVADLSLCVAPNGTPYLAFSDTADGKASVVKYVYDSSGTFSWVPLGVGLSPGTAGGLKLEVADDTLYLAFKDGNESGELTVMSYSDPLAGVDFNFLPPPEYYPGDWEMTGLDDSMQYSLDGGDNYLTGSAEIWGNIYETPGVISAEDDILVRLVNQVNQVLRIDLLAGPLSPGVTVENYNLCGLEPGRFYEIDVDSDQIFSQGTDIICQADDNGQISGILQGGHNLFNIRQAPSGKRFPSWQVIDIHLAC